MRRQDSNLRPPGYEPDELPTALLRDIQLHFLSAEVLYHGLPSLSTPFSWKVLEAFIEGNSGFFVANFWKFRLFCFENPVDLLFRL